MIDPLTPDSTVLLNSIHEPGANRIREHVFTFLPEIFVQSYGAITVFTLPDMAVAIQCRIDRMR